MFLFIIKWIIVSLLLIALIHYLYYFLINMFTVPKVRDLIYRPQQQYMELYKHIINTKEPLEKKNEENNDMSFELKKYVEELKTNN